MTMEAASTRIFRLFRPAPLLKVAAACSVLILSVSAHGETDDSGDVHAGSRGLALVYAGPGVCTADGCERAAAAVAEARGFRIRYVQPQEITEHLLSKARLWIQPGGNAIEAARAIGEAKMDYIRNYVFNGGRYLGFCAGGFLADNVVDDPSPNGRPDNIPLHGLGIMTSDSFDYSATQKSMLMPVNWMGYERKMYFQAGPGFRIKSPALVTIIAEYTDHTVAALVERFGTGKVAVSGPHPEAPQDWFDSDHLPKPDGLDMPYAIKLLDQLL